MDPILQTKDLTISFGGHTAVQTLNLSVQPYEFKSIIGPNGAGKTTLFNLISGQLKPTAGQIFFKGEEITGLSAVARTRRGIGRSFQITNLFPNLTVLENVRLAVQAEQGIHYNLFRHFKQYKEVEEKAYQVLEQVLLETKAHFPAKALAHGEKRKLEIAMLLALERDILLLDEPTAGMSLEEVPAILELIRRMKAERSRTILLIEHKMEMVLDLSDSLAVLFHGQLIADDTPEAIMENQDVQKAYLGGMASGTTA